MLYYALLRHGQAVPWEWLGLRVRLMTNAQIMRFAVVAFLFDGFALWARSWRGSREARWRSRLSAAYVFLATTVIGNLWLIVLEQADTERLAQEQIWVVGAMLLVVATSALWLCAELVQSLRVVRGGAAVQS